MVSLEQLLQSRDKRQARQAELLSLYPGKSIICLTVILPGPVKRDRRSERIAAAAVTALNEEFQSLLLYKEVKDLETGFEGYFVADLPPAEAKRRCCTIEDIHPLGRLMDIDVIVPSGGVFDNSDASLRSAPPLASLRSAPVPPLVPRVALSSHAEAPPDDTPMPLSREELGLPARKCLLCDRPARECMRSRAHSTEELLAKITELVENY